MMKLLIYCGILLCLASCYSSKNVSDYRGTHLYYKIIGVEIELLTVASSANECVILATKDKIVGSQDIYIRFKFDLQHASDSKDEKGNFPSEFFTKCSKEDITFFRVDIVNPSKDTVAITMDLNRLDTSLCYKEQPFTEFTMAWYDFKSITDFIRKFNSCHPDVQRSHLQSNGLLLNYYLQVMVTGEYEILTAVGFSNNRSVTNTVEFYSIKTVE